MKRSTVEDVLFPACPVRNNLQRLGNKWALLVLYLLARSQAGMLRFTELKQAMPDISQKMLATTLRTLEEDGYITRTLHAEVPPRVEYALTARAGTLRPILEELLAWAMENRDTVLRDRRRAHASKNENKRLKA